MSPRWRPSSPCHDRTGPATPAPRSDDAAPDQCPKDQPGPPDTHDGGAVPGLAEGAELAGAFAGSGYREPPHLVYRADGQVVRLPPVLYLVVRLLARQTARVAGTRQHGGAEAAADGAQILADVARAVSQETGRDFTADHIAFLLDRKLAPLGVTTFSDGRLPSVTRASPFLSLRFRFALLPPRATWLLAGLFSWLFHPAAMAAAITVAAVAEVWAFGMQSIGTALQQTVVSPGGILAVLVLAIASAAFHEVGHGTACRYGGVRPGATGCGIYLVWPAFYTDITNSYRLGRAGRLRADFGGVYFNGLFLSALALIYLVTGFKPLLVAILSVNLEIVQQLLPTLRFDGYYIVADLVGVPDLFRYVGPILRRALLRRPRDQRLDDLKRWPQRVVTLWVLCIVPALAAELGIVMVHLPQLAQEDWYGIRGIAATATASGDPVLAIASAAVQILLLLLPPIGAVVITFQLLRSMARVAWRRLRRVRPSFGLLRGRAPVPVLAASVSALIVLSGAGLATAWALTPQRPTTAAAQGRVGPGAGAPAHASRHSPDPRGSAAPKAGGSASRSQPGSPPASRPAAVASPQQANRTTRGQATAPGQAVPPSLQPGTPAPAEYSPPPVSSSQPLLGSGASPVTGSGGSVAVPAAGGAASSRPASGPTAATGAHPATSHPSSPPSAVSPSSSPAPAVSPPAGQEPSPRSGCSVQVALLTVTAGLLCS